MIFNVTGGGGTSLNFKIVGGTSQPTAPKENTIWVNTSVAIPAWELSATEPGSPVAGMVWISTGTSSGVAFNALKKNAIQVYPLSAKQYVGGQWVSVEAKTYQDGEWKTVFVEIHIVENGILNPEYSFSLSEKETATQGTASYNIAGSTSGYHTAWITDIDLTPYTTLSIGGTFRQATGFELCVWDKNISSPTYENHIATADLTETGAALDVSALKGVYSIGITTVYTHVMKIVNMWLG